MDSRVDRITRSGPRRPRRASLGAILLLVPWTPLAAAIGSYARAQETPGGVASEMVEQAIYDRLSLEEARRGGGAEQGAATRPGLPVAVWLLGVGGAIGSLVLLRRRARAERWRARRAADGVRVDGMAVDGASVEASARLDPSSPRRPPPMKRRRREPEPLRLPPHVVALLNRSAERDQGSSPKSAPDAPPQAPEHRGGLDLVVPSYDPRRAD